MAEDIKRNAAGEEVTDRSVTIHRKKKKKRISAGTIALIVLGVILVGFLLWKYLLKEEVPEQILITGSETASTFDSDYWNSVPSPETEASSEEGSGSEASTETVDPGYTLKCTVLDVGQGSAAVFESAGEYLIVDAGDPEHAQVIVSYLKRIEPSSLKYVCFTHWDADHIGGSVGILKNFSVENIWMASYTADTRTFLSLMENISVLGMTSSAPLPGAEYTLGECTIRINGPVKAYEEENANSISMTITDGLNAVYIGGDTTTESETDILVSGAVLNSDVYICNHHGSSSSSSEAFVQAISPEHTIISCGKDNDYGHPTRRVLNVLEKSGTKLYRTDTQGDIVFIFDGSGNVIFDQDPTDNWEAGVYKGIEE